MNKKALIKDIFREIRNTKARFISIMLLISLGVFVFVGLKATGPNMRTTGENYFEKYRLAEMTVQSTMGLDRDDEIAIRSVPGISDVEFGYSLDVISDQDEKIVRIQSMPKKLSELEVVEGRLPKGEGEILLDQKFKREGLGIGDDISFREDLEEGDPKSLKNSKFEIVGFSNSPEYISENERPGTNIGNGKVYGFGVVADESFDMEVYTVARLSFEDNDLLDSYSDDYDINIDGHIYDMKTALKDRPDLKLYKIKREAMDEISSAEKEIQDSRDELAENEQKLYDAGIQIAGAKDQYESSKQEFSAGIASAKSEIQEGQEKLDQSKAQLNAGYQTLQSSKTQIQDAKGEIAANSQMLEAAKSQLDYAQSEIAKSEQEIISAKKAIEAGCSEIDSGIQTLDSGLAQIELESQSLHKQKEELEISIGEGTDPNQEQTAYIGQIDAAIQELEEKKEELVAQKSELYSKRQELETKMQEVIGSEAVIKEKKNEIQAGIDEYNEGVAALEQGRIEIEKNEQLLVDSEHQLKAGEEAYNQGLADIAEARAMLRASAAEGRTELEQAFMQINENEKTYLDNLSEFNDKKADALIELSDAEAEVEKSKSELGDLKLPKYFVKQRSDDSSYYQYFDNADRMDGLSNIFPIFFFAIAMLVSLTTMTRMVDEQRLHMGTLKALGYGKADIAMKFIAYGAMSSIAGIAVGTVLGHLLLPKIVFDAYMAPFIIEKSSAGFYPLFTGIAAIIAMVCTIGAAAMVVRKDLEEKAAILMRPKAPNTGARILLERLKPIWNRMSFMQKVTARNLFRYKKRMAMTVVGVAGCTALIFMGIGINNSISGIVDRQYGELFNYDCIALYDTDTAENKLLYETSLEGIPNVADSTKVVYETVKSEDEKFTNNEISLIATEDVESLEEYVVLRDRETKDAVKIAQEGAVVSEKIAEVLGLRVGDKLTILNEDDNKHSIVVSGITENYLGHYIYMSKGYYESVFARRAEDNAHIIKAGNSSKSSIDKLTDDIMENKAALTVVSSSQVKEIIGGMLDSMDIVVVVILVCASLLAIVVLYNLTNINVSERERELSTIKVLGFFPREITAYIYREAMILTLLGILLGFGFGYLLHKFVLASVEPMNIMMDPSIRWYNFILSSLLTMFFSLIVMYGIHRKLKKIDMIESLKSVD